MHEAKIESENADLLPRKQPAQGRSKKTVEKILAATGRILERDGHRALTTVSVAEESGVTVGSIYQYFPTKHAIVYLLYTKWLDDVIAQIDRVLAERKNGTPARDVLRRVYSKTAEETISGRLTRELSAAMNAHPELLAVEAAHQQRIARRIAELLAEMFPDAEGSMLNQFAIGLYKLSTTLMDVVRDTPLEERDTIKSWAEATADSAVQNFFDLAKTPPHFAES